MNSFRPLRIYIVACLSLLTLGVPGAFGLNTWDGGGGNSSWNTADNWDNNAVPSFPVPLTFAGSTRLDPINNLVGVTVNSFTFADGASPFVISGNAITLGGNIANNSTSLQTIGLNMSTTAIRTVTLTPNGGDVTLSGNISGTGGGFSLSSTGDSLVFLTLSGDNSFTGGVEVSTTATTPRGLNIGHANALGTGTLSISPNNQRSVRLDNTSGNPLAIGNNISFAGNSNGSVTAFLGSSSLTVNGNVTLTPANSSTLTRYRTFSVSANTLTLAGSIYLSNSASTGGNLRIIGAGDTVISGVVSDFVGSGVAGTITKEGEGTLTLSNAANSYTGSTTIIGSAGEQGTIVVSKLADGGLPSSVGASSSEGANLGISAASVLGTLRYIGSGDSTNRLFTMNGSGIVFRIHSSGEGGLHFTNPGVISTGGTSAGKTLELGGTYTGENTMAVELTPAAVTGGTLALRKVGEGTWNLTNPNNGYTLATTVNGGTLLISGTGAINSSSSVTVNNSGSKFHYTSSTGLDRNVTLNTGGAFFHSGATNYSGTLTWTDGILGGTNWNGSNLNNLTVNSNRTISPGNSPGTAETDNQTWGTDGGYIWEVNNATGTAGADPGWDLVIGTGTLTITATADNPFTIYVTSLTLTNAPGNAVNFNPGLDYQWRIADFVNPIVGFDSDVFAIDASNFTNFMTPGSYFSVMLGNDPSIIGGDNTQIYLTYTIPEPSAAALFGIGLASLLLRRRARRAK